MTKNEKTSQQSKVFTIPNLLSFFRLCLIPVMVYLYCVEKNYLWTVYVLVLSGLTDIADGYIARHFHMTSDLGKILDPIADKLTQAAMLLCLITRFHLMMIPFVLLIVKEFYMGVTGFRVIQKTGKVFGAKWHGKMATFLLDSMMIVHVIWLGIPELISDVYIGICVVMMTVSLIMYGIRNREAIQSVR